MAIINQQIDYKLFTKFMDKAIVKYGHKKGSQKKALIAAIEKWLKK